MYQFFVKLSVLSSMAVCISSLAQAEPLIAGSNAKYFTCMNPSVTEDLGVDDWIIVAVADSIAISDSPRGFGAGTAGQKGCFEVARSYKSSNCGNVRRT